MKKNIKISFEQYKMLCEVDSNNFSQIITDDPIEPNNALSQISADGYKNDEDYADTKTTSDTDAAKKTPQGYVRYQRLGNSHYAHLMESGDADDIGEVPTFQYLDQQKNVVQIPQLVKERIQLLKDTIGNANLNDKQKAVILHDLTKTLTSSNTNYPSQKNIDQDVKGSLFGKEIANAD